MSALRVAGFFSGIGGFEKGLHDAGHETVLACELDPAAREVLRARFDLPAQRRPEDIRTVQRLPDDTDLICGGFPCQDLSSVGRKAGIGGGKSGIVEEFLRLLQTHRVEWVLLENVAFMLQLAKGRAMREITQRLGELGYRWAYRVVNSAAFGLHQRRRRVFLLASLSRDPRDVLLADDEGPAPKVPLSLGSPIGFYWTEGTHASGLSQNSTPPLKAGSTIGIPSPPAILFPDGLVATPDIRDAERLQGFPADWTAPAERVAKASRRWRLVGNAVSVDAARWIGQRLSAPEPYDHSRDEAWSSEGSWPASAWSMGGRVHRAAVSDHPRRVPRPSLVDFLRYTPRPLSKRATRGFLKRARAGSLRFPVGFLDALDAHLLYRLTP